MRLVRSALKSYAPEGIYLAAVNANNRRKGWPLRLSRPTGRPYLLSDGETSINFARENRMARYKKGIFQRCKSIAKDYHLDKVDFSKGDIILDCGANIGELGIWAKRAGLSYFAVEPEPLEADCCDLNNFDGEARTARVALWNEKTELTFYSSPDEADGSLIAPRIYDNCRTVDAVPLPELLEDWNLERVKLLKLEAEGAEPEILQGALPSLDRVQYVAADCGYERGVEQTHTFVEVDRLLREAGFELLFANFRRVTVLYVNRAK